MSKKSIFRAAALLALLTLTLPPAVKTDAAAAPAASPVRLTFDKSLAGPGVWEGTTGGDIAGGLRTELVSLRIAGSIWHVEFDWIVNAGAQSFTARLSGILNTKTGRVVMDGTVTDGYLEGARVHEEGQLIDPATLRFQGLIRVMPSTAR